MSSGFVSGGSLDKPVERDDEWHKAQEELDEGRKRKMELDKQNAGKSLYEVLQANQTAKQDAFEESNKLRNQFRALDDDEIEYLDTVMEKERAKEETMKKETDEQLATFRKHKDQVDKGVTVRPSEETITSGEWSVTGKKRKQGVERGLLVKGVKLRKTDSDSTTKAADRKDDEKSKLPVASPGVKSAVTSLGLAGYSSDDDD